VVAVTVLVISIAALDSLNPSTVLPAVVLGLRDNGPRRILLFTSGVFAVSTAGGIALLFAVGRTLLTRVAHPSLHTRHLSELIAGIVLVALGSAFWFARGWVRARMEARRETRGHSSFVLGAGIMAVELPTAFPYFAALVATLETVRRPVGEVVLVLVYNAVFIAPLLGVAMLAAIERRRVARLSSLLDRFGPVVVPVGMVCVGFALVLVGGAAL